jgi:hypothetical protein
MHDHMSHNFKHKFARHDHISHNFTRNFATHNHTLHIFKHKCTMRDHMSHKFKYKFNPTLLGFSKAKSNSVSCLNFICPLVKCQRQVDCTYLCCPLQCALFHCTHFVLVAVWPFPQFAVGYLSKLQSSVRFLDTF